MVSDNKNKREEKKSGFPTEIAEQWHKINWILLEKQISRFLPKPTEPRIVHFSVYNLCFKHVCREFICMLTLKALS